ncbi:helix-turn-helix domain-containing protein [Streptomyces sp. SP2-10]|uniref:helix-turn-helix domain-containing protein n=1 Tax=Streptomyces sp. SP2-10 TaxID=2873385 RepID=UPI001CA6878C|nr:helix-turn-helix domain-containing protein [Streptomyces sp. SP2-10]MBY8841364.1 helix-turn-helix domain-containing protein [Streptomyces sp. SP2-10]
MPSAAPAASAQQVGRSPVAGSRASRQTARKRLRRLEELFGDRLNDPAFRFEALLALRTRALTAGRGARPPSET